LPGARRANEDTLQTIGIRRAVGGLDLDPQRARQLRAREGRHAGGRDARRLTGGGNRDGENDGREYQTIQHDHAAPLCNIETRAETSIDAPIDATADAGNLGGES